jgi:hypothetical protein
MVNREQRNSKSQSWIKINIFQPADIQIYTKLIGEEGKDGNPQMLSYHFFRFPAVYGSYPPFPGPQKAVHCQ